MKIQVSWDVTSWSTGKELPTVFLNVGIITVYCILLHRFENFKCRADVRGRIEARRFVAVHLRVINELFHASAVHLVKGTQRSANSPLGIEPWAYCCWWPVKPLLTLYCAARDNENVSVGTTRIRKTMAVMERQVQPAVTPMKYVLKIRRVHRRPPCAPSCSNWMVSWPFPLISLCCW